MPPESWPAGFADNHRRWDHMSQGLARTGTILAGPAAYRRSESLSRFGSCAQELEIAKKECLILLDRSAQAEAPNLLDELIPGQWWSRDLVRHLIRIETWRLIKEKHVAMERIRAAARHHGDIASAGSADISGGISCHHAEFRQHVGIGTNGRRTGSGRAGLVSVDSIQCVIPGAVTRSVHVNSAPGVGPHHNTRLKIHEIERIPALGIHNRQIRDRDLIYQIAEVS